MLWRSYDRGVAKKLCPAQCSRGAVVVGVQKGKRLFLEEKKHGVNQLDVLGQIIQLELVSHALP